MNALFLNFLKTKELCFFVVVRIRKAKLYREDLKDMKVHPLN